MPFAEIGEEARRLAALDALNVINQPPEERFDRLTRLAVRLFDVPVAAINFLDRDYQLTKSVCGWQESAEPITHQEAFCSWLLTDPTRPELIVPDMLADPILSQSRFVQQAPFIRFYASCPLVTSQGYRVGTICLYDTKPRQFSEADRLTLHDLAKVTEQEFRQASKQTLSELRLGGFSAQQSIHRIDPSEESFDLSRLKRVEGLLHRQTEVLEFLASGAPLKAVLERLTQHTEEQATHPVLCSVLFIDPPRYPVSHPYQKSTQNNSVLKFAAGERLPLPYIQAIENLPIGPATGSCGTAAYQGQTVITSDIATDPSWTPYRDLALPQGLRACWSSPIFSQTGLVLGTLAVYSPQPLRPDETDFQLMQFASHLAGLAIERRRFEEKLAAEKQQLAVTLHSIADGVIMTDQDGRVVLLNSVAEQLTGYSRNEAVGRPIEEVFRVIEESSEEPVANPVRQTLVTGQPARLVPHSLLLARDGTRRRLDDDARPIRPDPDGPLNGSVLIFRDVTAQAQLEEELIRAQKLESVGVLAGGIAHDFNNLLAVIMGNISLAQLDSSLDVELTDLLSGAEKAVLRARDLTQQLLTFAKGGAPILRLSGNLPELLRDTTEFALRGSRVQSHFELTDELWPVALDESQLSQVVQNLVINAQQAMPQGGQIRITAHNIEVDEACPLDQRPLSLENGPYVQITVEDQGTGIAPEHLSRIFDPYFTTKPKGHGLGLASSYLIIKKHNGLLTVQSRLGVGTTFYIYLPAQTEAAPALIADPITDGLSTTNHHERVLLMEDDLAMGQVGLQMLERLGYRPALARDGLQALEVYQAALAKGQPFAAVILDLTIQGGSGGETVLTALHELNSQLPAIVSSGYSNDPVMAHHKEYGFRGVVTKPYKLEELGQTLRQILD